MKISKKDALAWFEFFSLLPEDEELCSKYEEIIYATFYQIEAALHERNEILRSQIKGLKTFHDRSLYVGKEDKFPLGCRSCLTGHGLGAVRKTNTCNLECKFCYNYGELEESSPIGEGMWEIGGTKFYERDLDLLFSIHEKPTGIAYVYLEPFMEIEKYYDFIKRFRQEGIHQHMYTNGTLVTEEALKALSQAGLNELRFNLGASNCSDQVIENIKLAKRYIDKVGIETPMTQEFYDTFILKKNLF